MPKIIKLFILITESIIISLLIWYFLFSIVGVSSQPLFYKGVIATAVAFLLIFIIAIFYFLRVGATKERSLFMSLCGLWQGVIFAIFIVLPVSYDRSVSLFLLSEINLSGQRGVSVTELQNNLIQKYVIEDLAVPRRIKEQIFSKNIMMVNNRYVLTNQGRALLCINYYLEKIYGYQNPRIDKACF